MQTERFNNRTEEGGDNTYKIVQELRALYPDQQIVFLNYGKIAPSMKMMFEAEQLDDLSKMTGRREGLFSDRMIGHAGKMMQDVMAVYWLTELYGADVAQLTYGDYNRDDVEDVVKAAAELNAKYNP